MRLIQPATPSHPRLLALAMLRCYIILIAGYWSSNSPASSSARGGMGASGPLV